MSSSATSTRSSCGILIRAPRDQSKGGDIEKTARQLALSLSTLSETTLHPFLFSGLEPPAPGFFSLYHEISDLKDEVARTQCLWLHDCLSPLSILAFLYAQKLKKPVLITQHTDIPFTTNILKRSFLSVLDRLITQPMLRYADQVTFSSDALAETYYHQVAFTKPVQIIPNGVDLDTFHPATTNKRRELRNRFSLRDDQPVVIFSGRFTPQHDMKVIYYLAHLLPDWRFWLIGNGSFQPEKWFLPNVQTFRNTKRHNRVELYQAADFLIAPTATARFPVGFQEALASGLPIISSPMSAEGSHFAKAHIETLPVNPEAPKDTALVWSEKLKAKRPQLPRPDSKPELANLAQLFWDQEKITFYYMEVLRKLTAQNRL